MSGTREGIKWFPRVTVARYSVGQTQWALEHPVWGPGAGGRLHGDVLRRLFPMGPEDGFAVDEGNSMVNGGLANLAALLTGAAASGSTGRPLLAGLGGGAAGSPCVGVGTDGTTAFAATQVHLANASGEGAGNSWYQSMDTGYPQLAAPATLNGQSTFQATDANFEWLEWCWVSGAGAPTAGPVLASVFATGGSGAMMNRKIPAGGLGRKDPGAAWVFQTSVVFS